jgi:anti-sigma28 factor (negative regulator of flagellin synthesis)
MKTNPSSSPDSSEVPEGHCTFFVTIALAAGAVAAVCAMVATASSFWAADAEDQLQAARTREKALLRRNAELAVQLQAARQQLQAVEETERGIRKALVEQLAKAKDELSSGPPVPAAASVTAEAQPF